MPHSGFGMADLIHPDTDMRNHLANAEGYHNRGPGRVLQHDLWRRGVRGVVGHYMTENNYWKTRSRT